VIAATREHYRQRRISECIRRYQPVALGDDKHGALDAERGTLIDGARYDDAELAKTKCRMLAAAEIERLYMPDEATALARIESAIKEHTDPKWAARVILDFLQGAKK